VKALSYCERESVRLLQLVRSELHLLLSSLLGLVHLRLQLRARARFVKLAAPHDHRRLLPFQQRLEQLREEGALVVG